MIVIGVDVSKERLDAALLRADGQRFYTRKVSNSAQGARALLEWASAKGAAAPAELRLIVEATGPYHERLAYAFHDAGATVIVANPKRVRDYAQGLGLLSKTDPLDARALAYYGAQTHRPLASWRPPSTELRTLQALSARLAAVEADLGRERNRLEKSAASATPVPAPIRESLARSIAYLEAERKRLKDAIETHYDEHPKLREQRERLKSIPGVGDRSADEMLCVIAAREFTSARQAAAFCGLAPRQRQSGSSLRAPAHLGKGPARLRAVLYMAAVVATRHNPELKRFYEHLLARGKCKMSAIGALMRKLIHLAYGILKHESAYDPALVTRIV